GPAREDPSDRAGNHAGAAAAGLARAGGKPRARRPSPPDQPGDPLPPARPRRRKARGGILRLRRRLGLTVAPRDAGTCAFGAPAIGSAGCGLRPLAWSRPRAPLPRRAPPPSVTSGDFARRERKPWRLEELVVP